MADIILSPVPYNGGTLALANNTSHICQVSPTKFFSIFCQTNPAYTYAAVTNVDSLKVATPVATTAKQRVINQLAITRTRCWKLNSSAVLCLLNNDLVVFQIGADDDVTQKAGTILNFHSTYLWGTDVATAYSTTVGTYISGQHIKDNTVWITQRTSTTSAVTLWKIEYDPVGDVLTKTQILQFAATTTSTHFLRPHIQQVPGTTNWCVYNAGPNNTALGTSTIPSIYFFDENGVQLSALTSGIPTGGRVVVPFTSSKILTLSDPRSWRYYDGTSWSTADTVFATGVTATTSLLEAEAIDTDYFMIVSTSTGAEPAGAALSYSFRVSRFVDQVFGQTSTATNTANGLSYAVPNLYFDQRILHKVDSEAYVIFGRASASAFRMRVLYQPGP